MEPVPNRAPDYAVEPALNGKGYEATNFNTGQIFKGYTKAHAKKRMDTANAQTQKAFNMLAKNPDVREAALGQKGESSAYIVDYKKYRKSAVDSMRKDFNKAGTRVRKAGK